MLSTLNDIKIGLKIIHDGEPYEVLRANFMRMQQRKPTMQTKMKNLITGKVLELNFKPGDRIEEAELDKTKVDYLYRDEENVYFMDPISFEQFSLGKDIFGEKVGFLREGEKVTILRFAGKPISVELPPKIDLKVIEAAPAVKGDTAQGGVTKQITLETGMKINAPLFIKEGDIVRVSTETQEYVERV